MILHDDLAGLEYFKMVQNRTGFLRLAFCDIILSPIALSCLRMRLAVSPISFRLTETDLKLAAQKQEAYIQAQMGTITGTVTKIPTEVNQIILL